MSKGKLLITVTPSKPAKQEKKNQKQIFLKKE